MDSERIARQKLGHEMLEPYLNRGFQASENAANRASRLNEIAAQGAQALQQLQLQEAGQSARASEAENAALQRQVLAGQQAVTQLKLGQAGDLTRTREQIAGNLATTKLGITGDILKTYLAKAGAGLTPQPQEPTGYQRMLPTTASGETILPAPEAFNPVARGIRPTGVASSGTIDGILRKYGLL